MSTVELIEQWLEKCDLAHQAQTRYDREPTPPTNYSRLKRAQEERGEVERKMSPPLQARVGG